MVDLDPVIIVGGGPVGLVCALRLAQMGIKSRVLEAEDAFPQDLRASTFHPPTLDMLDEIGVASAFVSLGKRAPFWQILDLELDLSVRFDMQSIAADTRHPFRLQCEQYKLTPLLLKHAMATGLVEIDFGAKVTQVTQSADFAEVEYEKGGADNRARAKYVIGADGAHSVVRRSLGLTLEGETYPSVTILITTPFPFDDHIPGIAAANYLWTRTDSGSLFHLPSEWRATFYPREGETDENMLSADAIQERLHGLCDIPGHYEIGEARPYRIHQRIVPNYRIGRVVLAGDAAHLNAPTGGMGMNGGIHDAFNLTEKLARVLQGEDDRLLDLYTRQRRPVALEEIIQQADQNRRRMQTRDPEKRRTVIENFRKISGDSEALRKFVLKSSMIEGLRRAAAIA
jgi:2-polyprenyl-6-methoxyphenol hydroxylase-like FAD-dependent oxidoreductase